ncbi:hypothetical protein HMPREF9303_0684 [Prevotella denticola CRIS 18C-A]|uniref:Uncharacterized protein n=1 Tax=Prevotella denticola CRIS 18C-A TaxID=944557 RepID=F0H8K9_9BACT|nr:hypothetical protein HMPREF9303_0684 [Prevotella denticola CRIS 18C-A]
MKGTGAFLIRHSEIKRIKTLAFDIFLYICGQKRPSITIT